MLGNYGFALTSIVGNRCARTAGTTAGDSFLATVSDPNPICLTRGRPRRHPPLPHTHIECWNCPFPQGELLRISVTGFAALGSTTEVPTCHSRLL